ncbi:MAG: retropepsin-like aspartic protease [bacterium]
MGVLIKELEIIGDKGRSKAKTLFDSGASDSVIRKDVAQKVASFLRLSEPVDFVLGDGKITMTSQYFTGISFVLKECTFPAQRVLIVDELEDEFILGVDAFQRWKFRLDFEHEDVIFDKSVLGMRLV